MTPRLFDTPLIETGRLAPRAPRMDDWPAWRAFYASDRAAVIGGPGGVREAWRAFAHVAGKWALKRLGCFVFTRQGSDAALGMAGPWCPEDGPETELGWTVRQAGSEGKGHAFEAARAARAVAFEILDWTTEDSHIAPGNARSVALADRPGATLGTAATPTAHAPDTRVCRHSGAGAAR